MIQRYFIQISYDGTSFHGWQIQPNAKTIQETLNHVLSTITRQEIYVVGCGRTDTGVHATQFYAHFESLQIDCEEVCYRVNRMLPTSVAAHRIFVVASDTHARFSATSRTYEYKITREKSPFLVHRAYEVREYLDLDKMNEAGRLCEKHNDFTSFAKVSESKTNLCNLSYAKWETNGTVLKFEVKANRFLRNMVRAMVGTFVEVGRSRVSLSEFEAILEAKDRSSAGFSAPAHGLYLIDIGYPEGLLK
jgi:tRNA pseudouridine38-40 synthase